ncbi:MAG: ActS/PrrB/RegB family redox-sensitive histidine kinase [Geminicoccaceae bacterium]|nr:ActS/PrrB/RegB family redox-sensitive histidine kinase [Geminicoccaceae bacterium]
MAAVQRQANLEASSGLGRPGAAQRFAAFLARVLGPTTGPGGVRLHTIATMRWIAVVGQLFTVLFVHFSLGIELPLAPILPAILLTALLNLALVVSFRAAARLGEWPATALFAYDVVQLCYLLLLTGGLHNPFAVLLLVPVAMGAATLGMMPTVMLTLLAVLGAALLAVLPEGLPFRGGPLVLPGLYLLAVWTGLGLAAILVAMFTWSIAEEARRHAAALAATQRALAREQKMSALGGQAAAAAHLLGSPLGTISVIAKELVRELPADSPLAEEARELLAQAQRCREILQTLGRRPQDASGARYARAPFSALLQTIAEDLARPGKSFEIRVEAEAGAAEPELVLPPALRHALANYIDNALRHAESRVVLTVRPGRERLVLEITDDGPGFPPELLDWVGEPYLTTRRGEGGLGLGIFIANTLLARSGAMVHFDNQTKGARVTVVWPLADLERAQEEHDQ